MTEPLYELTPKALEALASGDLDTARDELAHAAPVQVTPQAILGGETNAGVPGARLFPCERWCGRHVWIVPSSIEIKKQTNAPILCMHCLEKVLEERRDDERLTLRSNPVRHQFRSPGTKEIRDRAPDRETRFDQ